MPWAYLSDFDRLSPAQRAQVNHWVIDDPDRPSARNFRESSADFAHDVETERKEGWGYDKD